jgi:hypothetical protein
MNRLVNRVREKRRYVYIFILTLLTGVLAGILSASIYDYLTNTSQTLLFGVIPQALFFVIVSCILVITLLLITIFWLIWIPEKPDKTFPLRLIYNRKEGSIPVLSHSNLFLFHAGYAYQELSKERPEIKNILKEGKKLEYFILEMVEYLIIMWLSQKYHHWWALEQYTSGRWHGKNKPSTIITFQDLPKALREENRFFSTFSKYHGQETTDWARNLKLFRISLPENTKFDLIRKIQCNRCGQISTSTNMACPKCGEKDRLHVNSLLTMKNSFCQISISLFFSHWIQGVPLTIEIPDGEEEQDRSSYFQERFATTEFLLDFKARFNRVWSLLPSSDDYYQWVDDMLGSLYNDYCWIPFVEKVGGEAIKIKKGASFGIAFASL